MALTQFLAILLARRWIIIAAVAASLLGALAVIAIVPPRYEASARVMLDIIKPDPVTGQILGNQFVRAYIATQTELIKDYKVAGKVVDELGWMQNPQLMQQFPNAEEARRQLAKNIVESTDAQLIEGSNILEIAYQAPTPDAAKAIAELIRGAYIDVSLSFKRESAAESADWYQDQVQKARTLLAIAERNKAQFEKDHGVVMTPDKTDVDSARLAALSQQGQALSISGGGVGQSAAALELAKIDAQLADARRTLGANNPTLIELQNQRSALAAQVAQERSAAARAGTAASASAAAGARALETQKARVLSKSDELAQLRQLQDDVDLRRDDFQKASARAAELRLQANVADAGMTIMGSAVASDSPVFPKIPLIMLGALGFGAILGILAALLTEMLNRRVRGRRDIIEAAADVPLLAIIPGRRGETKSFITRIRSAFAARGDEALAA